MKSTKGKEKELFSHQMNPGSDASSASFAAGSVGGFSVATAGPGGVSASPSNVSGNKKLKDFDEVFSMSQSFVHEIYPFVSQAPNISAADTETSSSVITRFLNALYISEFVTRLGEAGFAKVLDDSGSDLLKEIKAQDDGAVEAHLKDGISNYWNSHFSDDKLQKEVFSVSPAERTVNSGLTTWLQTMISASKEGAVEVIKVDDSVLNSYLKASHSSYLKVISEIGVYLRNSRFLAVLNELLQPFQNASAHHMTSGPIVSDWFKNSIKLPDGSYDLYKGRFILEFCRNYEEVLELVDLAVGKHQQEQWMKLPICGSRDGIKIVNKSEDVVWERNLLSDVKVLRYSRDHATHSSAFHQLIDDVGVAALNAQNPNVHASIVQEESSRFQLSVSDAMKKIVKSSMAFYDGFSHFCHKFLALNFQNTDQKSIATIVEVVDSQLQAATRVSADRDTDSSIVARQREVAEYRDCLKSLGGASAQNAVMDPYFTSCAVIKRVSHILGGFDSSLSKTVEKLIPDLSGLLHNANINQNMSLKALIHADSMMIFRGADIRKDMKKEFVSLLDNMKLSVDSVYKDSSSIARESMMLPYGNLGGILGDVRASIEQDYFAAPSTVGRFDSATVADTSPSLDISVTTPGANASRLNADEARTESLHDDIPQAGWKQFFSSIFKWSAIVGLALTSAYSMIYILSSVSKSLEILHGLYNESELTPFDYLKEVHGNASSLSKQIALWFYSDKE